MKLLLPFDAPGTEFDFNGDKVVSTSNPDSRATPAGLEFTIDNPEGIGHLMKGAAGDQTHFDLADENFLINRAWGRVRSYAIVKTSE